MSDFLIRQFTHGKYSHCEIAVQTELPAFYECFTSSIRDGGVRSKTLILKEDHWDKIEINIDLHKMMEFYTKTKGCKYDLLGCLGILTSKIKHRKSKYFCSEWCAEVLGYKNSEKISPNELYKAMTK